MPDYSTFENFARDLFLRSLHFKIEISSKNVENDDPTLMDDASLVLDLFAKGHSELFLESFAKNEKQVLQTDEQFFKFALPRCLNLIDNDRYFYSLMLVAGFLRDLLNILKDVRECYRFHFIAYKCLAAVFKRSFQNSFESNGGWNGFREYLIDVIEAYSASKGNVIITALNDGDIFFCKKVKELVKHCDDISYDLNLNEYEISLLMDDDIKYIEESIDYDEAGEDPLNIPWPPEDEAIDEKLKVTFTESQYSIDSKDIDSYSAYSDASSEEDMDYSEEDNYLDFYAFYDRACRIKAEAEMRLGTEKFLEKMKLRLCPCCGIKCYQFSMKLSSKQIDLALTNKALGNSLDEEFQIKAKL